MPFKRRFKDKYAGSSPENASVVRTLFDLLLCYIEDTTTTSRVTLSHHELFHFSPEALPKRLFDTAVVCNVFPLSIFAVDIHVGNVGVRIIVVLFDDAFGFVFELFDHSVAPPLP